MKYNYTVTRRPDGLGGGWRLQLFEDDVEVGGGIFPVAWDEDPQQGVTWWESMTEKVQAHWLAVAGSMLPSDAWYAYLDEEVHGDAVEEGESWLDTRPKNDDCP